MSSLFHRCLVYTVSILHPYTIGRTLLAVARGIGTTVTGVQAWVNADDRAALRDANAVKHDRITRTRAWWAGAGVGADGICLLAGWFYLGLTRALAAWILAHLVALFLIGRTDPVMTRVHLPWMITETTVKRTVDDITSTPDSRKREERAAIVHPVARLANDTGWEATVRVPEHADPVKLRDGRTTLEHRMRKPAGTVFVYQLTGDVSTFRILALDENPWLGPPTDNPLVLEPRPVNLWREHVELGRFPDASPYTRLFVRKGVGGSGLFGAAPGMGKSVLNLDLVLPIILHVGSNLRLIDGKGLDFVQLKPVCATYLADPNMAAKDLLLKSIKVLLMLEEEMTRRRVLFAELGKTGVSEELCAELGLQLEWIVIDELAVITEDLIEKHKDDVAEFQRLILSLAKLGRALGIYLLLSTQRPTSKSVPPALKGIITGFRAALYIGNVSGSQAILDKAGPEMRADKLDPDQQGVGIVVGVGQVRFHNVDADDLGPVVEYALELRRQAIRQPGDYPEPIRSILELFEAEGNPTELSTREILEWLTSIGLDYTAISLAKALKALGVSPVLVGSDRLRGYVRAHLMRAHRSSGDPLGTLSREAEESPAGGSPRGSDPDDGESPAQAAALSPK